GRRRRGGDVVHAGQRRLRRNGLPRASGTQFGERGGGRRIPVVGRLGQQFFDDGRQRRGYGRRQFTQGGRRFMDVLVNDRRGLLADEGQPAAQQLVQHHPPRIQVRSQV